MPHTVIDYFWEAIVHHPMKQEVFLTQVCISGHILHHCSSKRHFQFGIDSIFLFLPSIVRGCSIVSPHQWFCQENWTATTTTSPHFHLSSFFWDFLIITGIKYLILWQLGRVSTLLFRGSLILLKSQVYTFSFRFKSFSWPLKKDLLLCFTLCGCAYVHENVGGHGELFLWVYLSSAEFCSEHGSALSLSN